jgi:hypothetical protein
VAYLARLHLPWNPRLTRLDAACEPIRTLILVALVLGLPGHTATTLA